MNKLIAIVGMCGSGKSFATEFFKNKGFEVIYFGGVTMKKLKEENIEITPENEKYMREKLRKEYGMGAYAKVLVEDIKSSLESSDVVLDGVYSWSEVGILKSAFPNLIILSIVVDKRIRYERLAKREIRPFNNIEAKDRDISEIENIEKGGPIAFADYYILNNDDLDKYSKNLEIIYQNIEKSEKI